MKEVLAFLLLMVFFSSYTGCGGGGGIKVTVNGQPYSIAWGPKQ